MLLSLMRRHAKSWLIKFLIAIIAVVFIFYFGYSFTSQEGVKVAHVNGELITGPEYQKAYRELVAGLQRQYQDNWDEDFIKSLNLRRRALDSLIDTKLISQEARELGLEVTEREIQEAIVKYPAFQVNGNFDIGRYRSLLSYNRMEPEDFEADMGRQLLDAKMKNFLSAFMTLSEQEVRDQYTYRNEKIKFSFVKLAPEQFKESIQPDQAKINKFFEEHKEKYRVPEEIKLVYIEIDPAAFRDQVELSATEVQSYYEYNLESYKQPEEVKARHILLRVSPDAAADEEKMIKKQAEAVLKQAREGKDFAELAKEHSEGPTKSKGGDLGWFSRGKMVKPFEEAVFGMQKGGISDLVRTDFGFHIIKVEDIREARTKSLEEVRDQIRETLQKQTSTELAHEKGLSLIDQMPYDVQLADYAAENELQTKATDYFPADKPIPELGSDKKLRDELFMLEDGEATGLVELNEKFYILQVADRRKSYLPELNAVSSQVKAALVADLAAKEARAAAEKYLTELKQGKGWKELAEGNNLEPAQSDFVKRRGTVPQIGYLPEMVAAAFRLSRNQRYPEEVFENDRGVFVIRWEARQGIDEENFIEERDQYRFSLMQAKQSRTVADWLENLRNSADIEIVTPVE